MVKALVLVAEAAGSIGHHALALGRADRGAQVGLARQAGLTLAAFGGVERDDMIAWADREHACPHLAHDARALVTQDAGEQAFAVEPIQRIGIGVADAGRHDLNQHLAGLWPFEIELDDLQRLLGLERNGGTGLH